MSTLPTSEELARRVECLICGSPAGIACTSNALATSHDDRVLRAARTFGARAKAGPAAGSRTAGRDPRRAVL